MKMKKIVPIFVLGILLTGLALPLVSSAQQGPQDCCKLRQKVKVNGTIYTKGEYVGAKDGTCDVANGAAVTSSDDWGMVCLLNGVYSITNWVFLFLIAIAVLMIIVSGFMFVTAGGDTEKTKKARDYMMYAAIGIGVSLLAKAVPTIVKAVIGV